MPGFNICREDFDLFAVGRGKNFSTRSRPVQGNARECPSGFCFDDPRYVARCNLAAGFKDGLNETLTGHASRDLRQVRTECAAASLQRVA